MMEAVPSHQLVLQLCERGWLPETSKTKLAAPTGSDFVLRTRVAAALQVAGAGGIVSVALTCPLPRRDSYLRYGCPRLTARPTVPIGQEKYLRVHYIRTDAVQYREYELIGRIRTMKKSTSFWGITGCGTVCTGIGAVARERTGSLEDRWGLVRNDEFTLKSRRWGHSTSCGTERRPGAS